MPWPPGSLPPLAGRLAALPLRNVIQRRGTRGLGARAGAGQRGECRGAFDGPPPAGADILARYGHVDILVNSAGLNLSTRLWKHVTPDTFDHIVGVNLNGALYCIHAVLPAMRAQKDGLVINVSSWAGRFEEYLTGPAYNASKTALAALTLSLNDEECVNGIRACCIYPGEVATPILRHRPVPPTKEEVERMLQAEDLGKTIRFVAEMPARVCVNEILITPTWNRFFIGGEDMARK